MKLHRNLHPLIRHSSNLVSTMLVVALVAAAVMMFAGDAIAAAPKEKVVYSFAGQPDGAEPEAGLILDAAGNWYGTTTRGGTNSTCDIGCGTSFELKPKPDGSWTNNILYSFGTDGEFPTQGLTLGTAGDLYGVNDGNEGSDIVFELRRTASGQQFHVIHSFQGPDGFEPRASLILDPKGNLYGTTVAGGDQDEGVVFELMPEGDGAWKEVILYGFKMTDDGANPQAPVMFDTAYNLYGATTYGGNYACTLGCGTLFKLTPTEHGPWQETLLHEFSGADGSAPVAGLVADGQGNLYGSASQGGASECLPGCGVIFKLRPAGGGWKMTVIHLFKGTDGENPAGAMVFDSAGNLYGTTGNGGSSNDGVVFRLAPGAHGKWNYSILHEFGNGQDGILPDGLATDKAGNLYGTTLGGGTFGLGTVFEVTP